MIDIKLFIQYICTVQIVIKRIIYIDMKIQNNIVPFNYRLLLPNIIGATYLYLKIVE